MITDANVFSVCLAIGLLFLGVEIGKQNKPFTCPVSAGQQVVSTIDSKNEQLCIYAESFGRAIRKVKAGKS